MAKHRPPEEYALSLIRHLYNYKWLYETQVIDIFESGIIEKIPSDWLESLQNCPESLTQIDDFAIQERFHDIYHSWPSTLKDFILQCHQLKMPRIPQWTKESIDFGAGIFNAENMLHMDSIMSTGMKSKKIHEVEYLSFLIDALIKSTKVEILKIVDVGSGKGYISQMLNHFYGYHMIGLEGSEDQHGKASKRFEDTEQRYNKKNEHLLAKSGLPSTGISYRIDKHKTINYKLNYEYNLDDLDNMLDELESHDATVVSSAIVQPRSPICLMSLHACGDLSPCIIRMFKSWSTARVLVNVGCCYYKMKEKSVCFGPGFPMSNSFKNLIETNNFDLSPHLFWMEMATSCPIKWKKMSPAELQLRVNKLCFRAILQQLFNQEFGNHPKVSEEYKKVKTHISKIKSDAPFSSFSRYVQTALKRLQIKKQIPNDIGAETELGYEPIAPEEWIDDWMTLKEKMIQKAPEFFQSYRSHQKIVEIFLALQITLAHVSESLLMLDRWMFLSESSSSQSSGLLSCLTAELNQFKTTNIKAWILPVFDEEESPRNMAIIGIKST